MPGFDDIFGDFDDIVDENDENDAKEDEWDTGKADGVWNSGEKENIWRTSAPAAPGDVWATAPDQIDPCAGGCDECEDDCDADSVPEETEECEKTEECEAEKPLRGGGDTDVQQEKSEFDQMEEYDAQFGEDEDEDEFPSSVFDDI